MIVSLVSPIAAADFAAPAQLWLIAAVLAGVAFVVVVLGSWLWLGRGPRRGRGYRRSQRLLRQGKWQEALRLVRELQHGGRLSKFWEGRLRNAEGECQRS